MLVALVVAYFGWKVTESPNQALQFAFNGMSVGAVHAFVAMGFTIVYSTVWFFDMYYGAAAALGAYGVFYLRSSETLGGLYEVNNPIVNGIFSLVVAGVVLWALHTAFYYRLRSRFGEKTLRIGGVFLAICAGAYAGIVLTFPSNLHITLAPAIAVSGELDFLILCAVYSLIVVGISWFLVSSSFGRVLKAIREDEQVALVFGYRTTFYKLAIWVISAMMAGLAGGLFGSFTTFVDPNSFILLESMLLVSIVILGGLASIRGSLLGALAFVLLEEGMRFVPFLPSEFVGQARQVLLGVQLVLLMLFRPQGLAGRYKL